MLNIMKFAPAFLKKQKLQELTHLTAAAFQCDPPDVAALSFEEGLARYADMTREQVEEYLDRELPLQEVKDRLFKQAYRWGQDLRQALRIKTGKQAQAALKELYRLLGIDFDCSPQGNFSIRQCFFSHRYTPEVCRLFSALDEGLAAGLSGGGTLHFQQRITEGHGCCSGTFMIPD